jgi:hypothetical protein
MRFEIFAPNARKPRTRSRTDPPRGFAAGDFFLATPPTTGGTRRLADMARERVKRQTRAAKRKKIEATTTTRE